MKSVASIHKAIRLLREQHTTSMNYLLSSTTLFKGYVLMISIQLFGFERGEKDY